jgi:hypothetical protein
MDDDHRDVAADMPFGADASVLLRVLRWGRSGALAASSDGAKGDVSRQIS